MHSMLAKNNNTAGDHNVKIYNNGCNVIWCSATFLLS